MTYIKNTSYLGMAGHAWEAGLKDTANLHAGGVHLCGKVLT